MMTADQRQRAVDEAFRIIENAEEETFVRACRTVDSALCGVEADIPSGIMALMACAVVQLVRARNLASNAEAELVLFEILRAKLQGGGDL